MHFVHPQLLWWLFALLIPIVVHLFNFRRHRTLFFSDVRLLRNLQQQTNKQRRLKHLLILLARMLAIASLVLAFARPYFKPEGAAGEGMKHVGVYLDNSLSMQLRGERMSLLDELRQHALSLPTAFRLDDRFRLLTNDFLPRHQQFMSADEFRQEVVQVRPSAAGVNLGQVLQRFRNDILQKDVDERFLYLLSDFQRSGLNFEQITPDSNLRIFLVPAKPVRSDNISVDSCWVENPVLLPGQPVNFYISLTNWGNDKVEALPVTLSVNNQQKAAGTVDIPAGGSTQTILQYLPDKAGKYEAVISVVDDPVVFDDELFLSFEVRDAIPVLEIFENQPNTYLSLLFADDPQVDYQVAQRLRLDVQMLDAYETIIVSGLSEVNTGLAGMLDAFVRNGGNLILFPSAQSNAAIAALAQQFGINYAQRPDTTRTRVSLLQTEHPLLKGAFDKVPENAELPSLKKWYALSGMGTQVVQAPVLMLNSMPMLVSSQAGEGLVYAHAAPLDPAWTNLMNNNLFVALMYRSLLLSNRNAGLYQLIDGMVRIPLASTFSERVPPELRSADGQVRLLPELSSEGRRDVALVYPDLLRPGFYGLHAGDSLITRLAVNETRKESVMDFVPAGEVKKMLQELGFKHVEVIEPDARGLGEAMSSLMTGRPVHQLFIWLTLLFLLAEVLIIRFFRK
ncbi:MAG: BatA domain-containing protein [Bacteroidetes bacterium]|nr:BatA domain-containing protein [Bacteroidota bacterium]